MTFLLEDRSCGSYITFFITSKVKQLAGKLIFLCLANKDGAMELI